MRTAVRQRLKTAILWSWALTFVGVVGFSGGLANAAKPLARCHSYLKVERRKGYREAFLYFHWERFEKHLKDLVSRSQGRWVLEIAGWASGRPLYRVRSLSTDESAHLPRWVVVAGMHGTEPVAVASALDLLEHALKKKGFLERVELVVYPAVNPWGLENFQRRNEQHQDINRSFHPDFVSETSRVLMQDLESRPPELLVDLHGARRAREHFVIRGHGEERIARRALRALPRHKRLGRHDQTFPREEGHYLLHHEGLAESANFGTLKSFAVNKLQLRHSFTLEYPGQVDPEEAHRLNFRLLLSLLSHGASPLF